MDSITNEETRARVVGVRVDRVDETALAILARRRRITKSAVIRQLIAEEARRVGVMAEPVGADPMSGHA